MPITLVASNVSSTDIDLSSLKEGTNLPLTFDVPATTVSGIQNYLYTLDLDDKTRHLLAFQVDTIQIGTIYYTVGHNAKRILSAGLSSYQESIEDYVVKKVDFDAKIFFDNLANALFDREDDKIMGARLVAGTDVCLTRTNKTKYKVSKQNFLPSLTREIVKPVETRLIVDYLLSKSEERRSEVLARTGTVRLTTAVPGKGRVRVTIGTQRGTHDITLRRIPEDVLPLTMFNLSYEVIEALKSREPGLYLIVGEPGSGKTALIASVLNKLLKDYCLNVESIEDPIEYTFKHQNSFVSQIEIGEDIVSVEEAVKKIKTDDPDIVFFTEIRTKEDAEAVGHLANMGVKVLATYHASSVETTLDGLKGLVGAKSNSFALLCKSIRVIIYQALLTRKDSNAVTPAHGVFIRESNVNLQESDEDKQALNKQIYNIIRRVDSNCKEFKQDVYNLYLQGIIDQKVLKDYVNETDEATLKTLYNRYRDNSPNYLTIAERRT